MARGIRRLAIGGGVAANSELRQAVEGLGVPVWVPPMELCTDNAAMVAACGTAMVRRGIYTSLDAAPDPNLPLAS